MLYNGNNDFYPTPAHLARKMFDKVKTVVNEFDGNEAEYNKTMQNRKYYLFDSNSVLMLENKAV